MRILQLCLVCAALFASAAALSVSCIDVSYTHVAFRCDPKQDSPCPEDEEYAWVCCSDDPAAAPGDLPKYDGEPEEGDSKWGVPLFSGRHNQLSRSGMCVNVATVQGPIEDSGAAGCPLPCNPTWEDEDIEAVCGGGVCCQTAEITDKDCTFDEVEGCFRPATGQDILDDIDPWSVAIHDTHQDPGGGGCRTLAATYDDLFDERDCYEKLSVANQRGFCAPESFQGCNALQPDYKDACDILNERDGYECGNPSDDDDDDSTSG